MTKPANGNPLRSLCTLSGENRYASGAIILLLIVLWLGGVMFFPIVAALIG